jgi:enolase-phosphatase E1
VARADWNSVRVVLLDIEGTTTPIDFVHKTLFQYASRNVEPFLAARSGEPEIRSILQDLKAEHSKDVAAGLAPSEWPNNSRNELRDCVAYVQWLMARDSKCAPLKALQGKIWQQGFESGELHGEVYADVPPAFARWRRQGRDIAIYSSGSVLAQRLLFGSVISGNLTGDIRMFFDPVVGAKAEPGSYVRIADALQTPPSKVLFLSDAPKEIDAARVAGMQAALCERPALSNSSQSDGAIRDFDEILPD